MAETKRSLIAHFVDTTPDETTETYSKIGEGVSDGAMSYNPNTETEQYVHEDTATTRVANYAPTLPLEQVVYPGDDLFDFVDAVRQAGPSIGDNDLTTLLEVRLYETPSTTGVYPATLWNVQIQIDQGPGGPGNANAKIGFTINIQGDPTEGDFATLTGVFTPDA